jgi:hypothetical protein
MIHGTRGVAARWTEVTKAKFFNQAAKDSR